MATDVPGATGRLRVLQLADLVNRHDFIDAIVEHADRDRFDVRVATFGVRSNIADPCYRSRGVETLDLRVARGRRDYPAAVRRLVGYLRRERIDIVHCHHFDPALMARMATSMTPTRLVLGRHYSDAIHLSTTGLRRRAYLAAERIAHRGAAAVIVPSHMIAAMVTAIGVPAAAVHVIPYPFAPGKVADVRPTARADLGAALGLDDDAYVIGTFGRLYRDKGHRTLLTAVAALRDELPRLRWVIVGDGPERGRLERAVAELGLGDVVRITGWRTDALALMAGVDAVVQPTWQEAFSSVMAESMWLRRPLVITDVSGATDVVTDDVNGLLVPKRDPAALMAAIRALVGDAALGARLGAAGRAYVATELTPQRLVPRYTDVYEMVAAA